MIRKTQEDLRRELYQELNMVVLENTVLAKKVVAFETSEVKYDLILSIGRRQLEAAKTLHPEHYKEINPTDEEVVVHVFEGLMKNCMDYLYETTEYMERDASMVRDEEKYHGGDDTH